MKYGSGKRDNFLLFNVTWRDRKGPQRVMGFASVAGINACKFQELDFHMDCTFKCTPKGFYQTLIFGPRDHGSNIFLPVFFVQMTTKTQLAYDTVFFHIKMSCVGKSSFSINIYFLALVSNSYFNN